MLRQVEKSGGFWGRPSVQLKDIENLIRNGESKTDEGKILSHVRKHGSINNSECRELLGSNLHRASYLLKKLTGNGYLIREGKGRWTIYRLP